MKESRIVIDPTSRILYSSFYIQGLYETFGKRNVSFGRHYFRELHRAKELFSFNHYFAFVQINDGIITRYVIDFCDPPDISNEAYEWCDIYAKINFDPGHIHKNLDKLRVIPPSFGVRIWSLPETIFQCLKNSFLSSRSIPVSGFKFIQDYWHQYQRLPLAKFLETSKSSDENYIFLAATLWTSGDEVGETNQYRKKFIETCRSFKSIKFEGGLFASKDHPDYNRFEDVIIHEPYSLRDFLNNSKKSIVVFNTPAVHNCHGWKLAEFLAIGSVIISSKLSYSFTKPLVHGEHVHFISSEGEIESAITELVEHPDFRAKLARNAQQYFSQFMSPKAIIKSLTL